jgi:hypothetical protein
MLAQPLATSALTLAPQSRASSPDRSQRVGPPPMAARPRRASALACVCVAACLRAACSQVVIAGVEPPPTGEAGETMSFFATSDWGGQAAAPYTTPLQLQMAASMGHVSASFHPHFVVSAGGNFLPGGLPGAYTAHKCPAGGGSRQRWTPRSPCPPVGPSAALWGWSRSRVSFQPPPLTPRGTRRAPRRHRAR